MDRSTGDVLPFDHFGVRMVCKPGGSYFLSRIEANDVGGESESHSEGIYLKVIRRVLFCDFQHNGRFCGCAQGGFIGFKLSFCY